MGSARGRWLGMSENVSQTIAATLELAAERCGDVTDLVYTRLFAEMPETQALFDRDRTGAARGAMLAMAFDMALDLAASGHAARAYLRAGVPQHEEMGVAAMDYPRFFAIIHAALRDALGQAWPSETERAWAVVVARAAAACG